MSLNDLVAPLENPVQDEGESISSVASAVELPNVVNPTLAASSTTSAPTTSVVSVVPGPVSSPSVSEPGKSTVTQVSEVCLKL